MRPNVRLTPGDGSALVGDVDGVRVNDLAGVVKRELRLASEVAVVVALTGTKNLEPVRGGCNGASVFSAGASVFVFRLPAAVGANDEAIAAMVEVVPRPLPSTITPEVVASTSRLRRASKIALS